MAQVRQRTSFRPSRILITGVSGHLGARLANLLSAQESVQHVVGVDTVSPAADLGRTEFVRADIRNPLIFRVIDAARIDTVIHMNVISTPISRVTRAAVKETNVIGTMQLLAACQKAAQVRKFVLKSTTSVYGSSPRDPAVFTEEAEPRAAPRGGYTADAMEVESYVRGFGRRRPDVALTVLRFTNLIGPTIDSFLTRYFALPVVPTLLGFDPRIQLCHEKDALAVLAESTLSPRPGTFNVGGAGVLLLSQAVRRAGRASIAVPVQSVSALDQVFRRSGLLDFSPEQVRSLSHGRVVDTARLRADFAAPPRWSSAGAFQDYLHGSVLHGSVLHGSVLHGSVLGRGISPAAVRAWSAVAGRVVAGRAVAR